jgi:hypothetical protein
MASFTSPLKRVVLQDLGLIGPNLRSSFKACRRFKVLPLTDGTCTEIYPHIRRPISGPSVFWANFSICSDTGDGRLSMT